MMALADCLRWMGKEGGGKDGAKEAEGVRARLQGVAGRMAASKKELAAVLGKGVL